jgi:hypothetical protein
MQEQGRARETSRNLQKVQSDQPVEPLGSVYPLRFVQKVQLESECQIGLRIGREMTIWRHVVLLEQHSKSFEVGLVPVSLFGASNEVSNGPHETGYMHQVRGSDSDKLCSNSLVGYGSYNNLNHIDVFMNNSSP